MITEKTSASHNPSAPTTEDVPRQRLKHSILSTPTSTTAAYVDPMRESVIIATPARARPAVAYIGPIRKKPVRAANRREPVYHRNPDMQDRPHKQQQHRRGNVQAKVVSEGSVPRPEEPSSTTDRSQPPSPTTENVPAKKTELTDRTPSDPSSLSRSIMVVSPTTPTSSELISFYNSDDLFSEPPSPATTTHRTSLDLNRKVFPSFREGSRKAPEEPQIDQIGRASCRERVL